MRRVLPLVLLLAACSDPGFAPPVGGDGDDGIVVLVPITGTAYDSVTGAPLLGITVAIQGQFLVTDPHGVYTGQVALGANTINVSTAGYERFSRAVTVEPVRVFDLPLRRLAPYPTECEVGPAGFTAIVIDLQGRKSLERWSESSLTLVAPGTDRTIGARQWGYDPLDMYQVRVTIADAGQGITRADWQLYDSQGDLFRGSCEPSQAGIDSTTY